jgi:hypothetical protein
MLAMTDPTDPPRPVDWRTLPPSEPDPADPPDGKGDAYEGDPEPEPAPSSILAANVPAHANGTARNGHAGNGMKKDKPQPEAVPELVIEVTPWPTPPDPAAYHGLAGDVVRRIDPETEADPVAILVQFLAWFGNAIGRSAFYPVGASRHHPNLYVCLVGRTAKARKGTSLAWVRELFTRADPGWSQSRVLGGLSSGEGLIHEVRDQPAAAGEEGNPFGPERDKRLLAVEEEFAGVLRASGREGNTLSAVLRQGFDSGNLGVLTRNHPLRARGAHISLVAHVTRDELVKVLSTLDVSNGLANRFLWVCARRSKLLPDGGNLLDLADLTTRLCEALEAARVVRSLSRDTGARDLWHHHYERLTTERPGTLGLVTNRAEVLVLRLSVIYALLDRAGCVRREHLAAALALWDYAERSCRWVFGESAGSDDADELLALLRQAGPAGLTATEISNAFGRHKPAAALKRALTQLCDHGLVSPGRAAAGGRPAEPWKYLGPAKAAKAANAVAPQGLTSTAP